MSVAGMSLAGSVKLNIDENNQIIWLFYPSIILKKIKPLLDNKLFIWHASCWVKFYAHEN
jgi:hypothetical protein